MVHGSPRPESNEDVFAVIDELRRRALFGLVEVGFLDVNQPDIPTAVETLVSAGAEEIVAVPYFLHSGKHVTNDLPGILDLAARRHPSVRILMGDYLGHAEAIADVLRDRVGEAVGESD